MPKFAVQIARLTPPYVEADNREHAARLFQDLVGPAGAIVVIPVKGARYLDSNFQGFRGVPVGERVHSVPRLESDLPPVSESPKGRGRTRAETAAEHERLTTMLADFRFRGLTESADQTAEALRQLTGESVLVVEEEAEEEPGAELLRARAAVGYFAGLVKKNEELTGSDVAADLEQAQAALEKAEVELRRMESRNLAANVAQSDAARADAAERTSGQLRATVRKAAKRAPVVVERVAPAKSASAPLTAAEREAGERVEAEIRAIDLEIPLRGEGS
jgi:hypothetical protein